MLTGLFFRKKTCNFKKNVYNSKGSHEKSSWNERSWRNWQTRTVQVRVRRLMGVRIPLTAPKLKHPLEDAFFVGTYLFDQKEEL